MDTYIDTGALFGPDKIPDPAAELLFFGLCPDCGQAFDVRDPAMIDHHAIEGHDWMPRH